MNNFMQIFSMIKNSNSPQAMLMNMINNNPNIINNPIMQNAMSYMQNGKYDELETLARNLCKERNVNPDELIKQMSSVMK